MLVFETISVYKMTEIKRIRNLFWVTRKKTLERFRGENSIYRNGLSFMYTRVFFTKQEKQMLERWNKRRYIGTPETITTIRFEYTVKRTTCQLSR